MKKDNDVTILLRTLEDLLVSQFRRYQTLHSHTKEERQALLDNDIHQLLTLLESKEVLVEEINHLETNRHQVTKEWAQMAGMKIEYPTLTQILPGLDVESAKRLSRLREGILVLVNEIRELVSGNRALTSAGLKQVEAVQTFILGMGDPLMGYQPPGKTDRKDPLDALEVEKWA